MQAVVELGDPMAHLLEIIDAWMLPSSHCMSPRLFSPPIVVVSGVANVEETTKLSPPLVGI